MNNLREMNQTDWEKILDKFEERDWEASRFFYNQQSLKTKPTVKQTINDLCEELRNKYPDMSEWIWRNKVLIEFPGDNGVEQKRALMYFFTNVALKEFELVNSIPASYNEDYENYKKYKRRKDNTSDQALEIKVKKDQEKEDQERIERLQTKLKNEKQSYEKLLSEELSKYKTLEDKYLKLIIKNNNDSSELDKLEDALSYHENNIEKIENQIVIKDQEISNIMIENHATAILILFFLVAAFISLFISTILSYGFIAAIIIYALVIIVIYINIENLLSLIRFYKSINK